MAALQLAPPMSPLIEEFVLAFHDLQNDSTKLIKFVRSYYVNNLNAPKLCSALQLRLNPTNNDQPGNDPALIIQNFLRDIYLLRSKHSTMEMELKSMNGSFSKHLHSIDVSNKVYTVLFSAAAMLWAAVAAIVAADVTPVRGWARAGIGAAAAAASLLFTALGKWRRSVLMKREAAVKKHKDITDQMIMAGIHIMTDLDSVDCAARALEVGIKSLSEAVDDGLKVAAVGKSFEELLRNDKKYSSVMKWAKKSVLHSIGNQLG